MNIDREKFSKIPANQIQQQVKDSSPGTSEIYPWDVEMFQHMHINKCDTLKRKKTYDYLNGHRESLW